MVKCMKTAYTYCGTDQPIEVGDAVMVRVNRFLLPDRWLTGVVTYVHDPEAPETLERDMRGLNDPVVDVRTEDGVCRPIGAPFDRIKPRTR